MLLIGQNVFVSFVGGSTTRVLHPVRITDRTDEVITIKYAEPDGLPAERSETVTVFFDGRKGFMQQPGEIVPPDPEEGDTDGVPSEPVVAVRLLGEPVSAESRECYRVSTVLADYHANFGRLGTCKLVDVSATGFGFLSTERLMLGETLEIEFTVGGKTIKGSGIIQSLKEVRNGFRYGMVCVLDGGASGMALALQQLTVDAQRTQLRRLSGAA